LEQGINSLQRFINHIGLACRGDRRNPKAVISRMLVAAFFLWAASIGNCCFHPMVDRFFSVVAHTGFHAA
jgi:hypothetical protein